MSASTEVDIASTDFLVLYRSHFKSYLAVREIIAFTEVLSTNFNSFIYKYKLTLSHKYKTSLL